MGRERGQITVFFALILLCVCSLMGGLFESARTAGMRWYLRTSADSAMDSVFSHYHKEVWRSYRLLLLQREDWEMTALWEQFLTPYLEKSGWYEAALQDAAAEGVIRITDGNGRYPQTVPQAFRRICREALRDCDGRVHGDRKEILFLLSPSV